MQSDGADALAKRCQVQPLRVPRSLAAKRPRRNDNQAGPVKGNVEPVKHIFIFFCWFSQYLKIDRSTVQEIVPRIPSP